MDRLWQLAGVQHVLTSRPGLYQPAELLAELPADDGSTFLHRLTQPMPRAWIAHIVQSLEDGPALPLLADTRFDPSATALLPPVTDTAGRAGFAAEGLLATPGQNTVRMEQLAPGRLRLDVQSEHGGLLVVSENWLPGWKATVRRDGNETAIGVPVLRADVTFLGVPVTPGHSVVELAYRPASVRLGLLISGGILLALVAAVLWRMKRRTEAERDSESTGEEEKWARWAMVALVLAAFALRVFRLGYQELRGDETFGYFFSLNSLPEIVRSTLSLHEPHPVASYFLQHGWLSLAGHSEFALRFVSAWFGVLSVTLLYRLGRRLGLGAWTSILAAALMAVSPYAVWHSQDARMYTISLALTLASTWLALEVIRSGGRLRYGLAYVLVSLLALHTHYFAVFVLLAQNIFVLCLAAVDRPIRRIAVRWLLYQALLGLLWLPWLLVAASTLTGYAGTGNSPAFASMLQRSLSVFGVGETIPAAQRNAVAVLSGILLLLGAVRLTLAGPLARRILLLLALYLVVPLLATWLSALQRPIFNERYLIAAVPPFFLLLAVAVLGKGKEMTLLGSVADTEVGGRHTGRTDDLLGWMAVVVVGLLLFSGLGSLVGYYTDPTYSKTRGWRELAAALERYSAGLPAGHVRIVENFPEPTLWYYYRGPVDHLVLPPRGNDEVATAQEVERLVSQGVQRVVIPIQPADWWDRSGIAEQALAQEYTLAATSQVANWPVQVYVRPPTALSPVDEVFFNTAQTGDTGAGVRLAAVAIPAGQLVAGDILDVHLKWEGSAQALSGTEKITLQLLNSAGQLVAQTDQPLSAADLKAPSSSYMVPIPWQLSPGDHTLIAALYDPAQPGAPRWLNSTGSDYIVLAVLPTQNP